MAKKEGKLDPTREKAYNNILDAINKAQAKIGLQNFHTLRQGNNSFLIVQYDPNPLKGSEFVFETGLPWARAEQVMPGMENAGMLTNYDQRIDAMQKSIDMLNMSVTSAQNSLMYAMTELKKKGDEIDGLKEYIYYESLKHQPGESIQLIPVSIFFDSKKEASIMKIEKAVNDFLETLDFKVFIELTPVIQSWWKRAVAKTVDVISSDEVTSRLKKAEYALEVNTVLKQQSEIDKNHSESLMNIMKSLDSVKNAAIRIGSLLVLKMTDHETGEVNLQVRTLNILELDLINRHPEVQNSPHKIVELLSKQQPSDTTLRIN
jgi:hypothetical protein